MEQDYTAENIRALKAALPFLPPGKRRAYAAIAAVLELQTADGQGDDAQAPPNARQHMFRAVCAELTGERRAKFESWMQLMEMADAARAGQPPFSTGGAQ